MADDLECRAGTSFRAKRAGQRIEAALRGHQHVTDPRERRSRDGFVRTRVMLHPESRMRTTVRLVSSSLPQKHLWWRLGWLARHSR
jgi:hypothetical protein